MSTENTWVWDNGTTSGDNGLTDDLCGTVSNCRNSNAKWADNTDKWCNSNPDDHGANGQDCGYIWKKNWSTSYGCWDDGNCSVNKKSIIEFDL